MARVRHQSTTPELIVRREAHRIGLRFRVNVKELPGTPDIVFPRWNTILLVHGCFWHRHHNCVRTTTPKLNASFWATKFHANKERDRKVRRQLSSMGWRVKVVWVCQTADCDTLSRRLRKWFP
ncbi:MAG: DNA mismatch endonuclease Vsr [Azonexus sp.]|nr:DNA mismatch endonuclease Vsr [Azonexus sp.]